MFYLILGIAFWISGHLWNRFLPDLYARMGKAGYGISAVLIVLSVILMVIGYRGATVIPLWPATQPTMILNNLLMVFAFYTYFSTATPKGTVWLVGNLKHPQLSGFCIWAIAHLLVNGDLASLILFGTMLIWAMVEVSLINKQGGNLDRSKAPIKSRVGHLILVGVAFTVVACIHVFLGVNPFGA